MANRAPLVVGSTGLPQQLQSGDALALAGALNFASTVTVPSATTTDIGAAVSNEVIVSGVTTITALGTIAAGAMRMVQFSGILTLTHNATSLILPGGASITTAAGDCAEFVSLGTGNWRCTSYSKASGTAVVGGGGLSGLTAARVPYATSATAVADDAGLTYDAATKTLNAGATLASAARLRIGSNCSFYTTGAQAVSFGNELLVPGSAGLFGTVRADTFNANATVDIGGATKLQVLTDLSLLNAGGSAYTQFRAAGYRISGAANTAVDLSLDRNAAGVAEFNNGTMGAFRDWKARNGILTGNLALGIVAKTASYTVTANDGVIEGDATAAAITLTLPAVATATAGTTYTLKKTDASANAVIWDGNASETIDGATTVQTTTQWASITIIRNTAGTAWLTLKD